MAITDTVSLIDILPVLPPVLGDPAGGKPQPQKHRPGWRQKRQGNPDRYLLSHTPFSPDLDLQLSQMP
jgi:hypothetical protein